MIRKSYHDDFISHSIRFKGACDRLKKSVKTSKIGSHIAIAANKSSGKPITGLQAINNIGQDPHSNVHVILRDYKGWHEPDNISLPCCDDNQPLVPGFLHNVSRHLHRELTHSAPRHP